MMLRTLRRKIETPNLSIVDCGSVPVVTQQAGTFTIVIGKMHNLAIEDGSVVGTLEFTGRYAQASQELYQTNIAEPQLSLGVAGVCLTF